MTNLDFYANIEDHEIIINDIFNFRDVRIFESYSMFDCDLKEFTKPEQILDALRVSKFSRHAVLLQIWVPAASSKIEIERFMVSVQGHTYRHRISGWGLMQMYMSRETEFEVYPSHFGHFSQRGAEKRSNPISSPPLSPGTSADWDWGLIQKISRRIQYSIRSHASDMKVGSIPVLQGAARLMKIDHHVAAN